MSHPPPLQQRSAAELASGYSPSIRALEVSSITAYSALLVALGVKVFPFARHVPWLVLLAAVLGYLAADFVSGFVHWMADSWGSVEMPVVGKALLRPFREHHVDPEAITRHDFIETNGNNCLISIVPLLVAYFLPEGPERPWMLFFALFTGSLVFWVMATNQFHKWAHLKEPRGVIALLQRLHLILPPAHHSVHHGAPFNTYYCITVGWLNYPLSWTRFFPSLEWLVTSLTGALPRKDDIGEASARLLCPEPMGPSPQQDPSAGC